MLKSTSCHCGFLETTWRAAIGERLALSGATGKIDDHDFGVAGTAVVANSEGARAAIQRRVHYSAIWPIHQERAELGGLYSQALDLTRRGNDGAAGGRDLHPLVLGADQVGAPAGNALALAVVAQHVPRAVSALPPFEETVAPRVAEVCMTEALVGFMTVGTAQGPAVAVGTEFAEFPDWTPAPLFART